MKTVALGRFVMDLTNNALMTLNVLSITTATTVFNALVTCVVSCKAARSMASVMQVNIVQIRRASVCRDRTVLTMQTVVTASAVIRGAVSLRYAEMTMTVAVNSPV